MKYYVGRKEIYEQMVVVEAEDVLEAIQKVADGEGIEDNTQFEYVDTMDTETWNVYPEEEK